MDRQAPGHGTTRTPNARPTAVTFDSYRLWLDMLARVSASVGVDVVGASTSARETIRLLEEQRPSIFLLGIERGDGSDAAAQTMLHAATRIGGISTIVVSTEDDPEFIEQCLARGASAYVLKTIRPDDLSATLRQAVDRCVYLFGAPKGPAQRKQADAELWNLTARELEVLTLVADSLTNSEVARRLWVSVPTVKFHLSRIYEKLGVPNRTGAVLWAQSHGLLEPDVTLPGRAGRSGPQSLSSG
jgi:DNA-binding NarL/FixJ family response regulator